MARTTRWVYSVIAVFVVANTVVDHLNRQGIIPNLVDHILTAIPPIALAGFSLVLARRYRLRPLVARAFMLALLLVGLEQSLRITDNFPSLNAVPLFGAESPWGRPVRVLAANAALGAYIAAIVLAIADFERIYRGIDAGRQHAARTSRMLRAVLDTIPVRVFWKSRDLRYLGSNALFAVDAGKSAPEDLVGLTDFDLVPREEAVRYQEDDRAVIQGAREKLDYEQAHYRQDGSILWHRTSKVPLRDEEGAVIGVLGMYEDISATKWAQLELRRHREQLEELVADRTAALRRSEERFARAAAAGRVGIWDYDFARGALYLSSDLKALLGYGVDALPSTVESVMRLMHPEDESEAVRAVQRYLAGESDRLAFEHRAFHRDGSIRWFMLTGELERDEAGNPKRLLGVDLDITARKRVEEDLRCARDAAEAAAQAKSDFLANMSHEIRTPMNGVLGMAQLMIAGELSPEQRRRAEILVLSGEGLIQVIDDILDISKIDAGGMTIDTAPLDVVALTREVCDTMAVAAANAGLEFDVAIGGGIPAPLLGDPVRIRQILGNLVGNAVKFTPKGSIRVSLSREDADGGDRVRLRFDVADTGIGIEPGRVGAIFEKFSQADSSTTRRFGGTGLGLAISQRLAHLMGGEIDVASAPGEGSTFTLRLPLAHVGPPPLPGPKKSDGAAGDAAPARTARILVAEDNEVNARVARALLKPYAARLDLAADGFEALALAKTNDYDVVFMDLHMPAMGGLEATVAIRALPRHTDTPIVAMTASVLPEDRQRCREVGMSGFLPKPIQAAEIAALMRGLPSGAGAEHD